MTDMPYGDEAIRKGSGKTWSEWRELLDAWGAADMPHNEIARYVASEHGVEDWWAQGVTVGYERMIGRRSVGERRDGTYSTSASKTMKHDLATHFQAWIDEAQRDRWMPPGTLTVRTSTEHTSIRFDDNELGGVIALWFTDKGLGKSSVSVQIDNLPTKADITERKLVWKDHLDNLAEYLDTL